ncbi:MAG: hypothetical protein ACJ8AO_10460 [Gemmatimonadaceae bacterium]
MRLSLVVAVAAALALSAPVHAAAGSRGRSCGEVRIDGKRFAIYEQDGHAACRKVKPVIVHYMRTFEFKRPWFCALGHGKVKFAAACANKKVLLRAYARS